MDHDKPIEERLLDATFALAWIAGALESAESADSSITRDVQRELLAMAASALPPRQTAVAS